MDEQRAGRALSLQHHLHVGGNPLQPTYDDGSSRRPHATYAPAARTGFPLRLRLRRRR